MVKLLIPSFVSPLSVDFGPNVERSTTGALYFNPGTVKTISDSEWAWIRKNRPVVAKQFRVLCSRTQYTKPILTKVAVSSLLPEEEGKKLEKSLLSELAPEESKVNSESTETEGIFNKGKKRKRKKRNSNG